MQQMVDRIKSFQELKVDIFQSIKRAFLHKGYFPAAEKTATATTKAGQGKRAPPLSSETVDTPSASAENKEDADASSKTTATAKEEKAAEEGPAKLVELTERTHETLYEATTVFPFTLFPDTVRLDREKLTIAKRYFWRTANITSVPVSEVLSAVTNVGPFFGSLHLVFSFFADNERTVNFLKRKDSLALQKLLHGYIIAYKRKINTTNIKSDELKALLNDLGGGISE
jgi:hypothetical protein